MVQVLGLGVPKKQNSIPTQEMDIEWRNEGQFPGTIKNEGFLVNKDLI